MGQPFSLWEQGSDLRATSINNTNEKGKAMAEEKSEAFKKGAAELLEKSEQLDGVLRDYMGLITNWALKAKVDHNLSEEALCVLLDTAPSAHIIFHGEMRDRQREADKKIKEVFGE